MKAYQRHPSRSRGAAAITLAFAYSGRIGNKVGFASGLDTRSDGGLIVAEPSIHASGREYTWEVTSHPDDMPLATMPEWLINLITQAQDRPTDAAQHPTDGKQVSTGARNATLTSLAGTLARSDYPPMK